jgi:hypothetical protein
MRRFVAISLLVRLAACITPREGAEYALLSMDGRYLVADAEKGLLLLPPSAAGHRRKFEFVRVAESSDLVYLRFGVRAATAYPSESYTLQACTYRAPLPTLRTPCFRCVRVCVQEVLLTAYTASGGAEPQFQVYTRADGKVALLAAKLGTCLRARRTGSSAATEQGTFSANDEHVWWRLQPASRDAARACKASSGGPCELEPPPVRAGAPRATSVLTATGSTTPRKVVATSAALVIGATAALLPAQLSLPLSGSALASLQAPIAAAMGAMPAPVREAGAAAAGAIKGAVVNNELGLVLAHGLLSNGVSDALAQAIAAREEGALQLDWKRIRRTTAVSFLSDDLPFILWVRALWKFFERAKPAIAASTVLPPWLAAALSSPLGIAALKTAASQIGYESTSTAAYLGMQEAARGGGPRRILREIRQKFWRAWKSGLAFFSVTHLLIFMLPLWWLQPLLDNLSCLAFNTYLAMLSHADDDGGGAPQLADGNQDDTDEAQSQSARAQQPFLVGS